MILDIFFVIIKIEFEKWNSHIFYTSVITQQK